MSNRNNRSFDLIVIIIYTLCLVCKPQYTGGRYFTQPKIPSLNQVYTPDQTNIKIRNKEANQCWNTSSLNVYGEVIKYSLCLRWKVKISIFFLLWSSIIEKKGVNIEPINYNPMYIIWKKKKEKKSKEALKYLCLTFSKKKKKPLPQVQIIIT